MKTNTPELMAEELRRSIRDHTLAPGDLLVQEDLARQFGVSRNPVREALRILAGEGLVVMAQGERASVRHLSADDLCEIYDMRLAWEPSLAGPIIDSITRRRLSELESLVDQMDSATTLTPWMHANFEFHRRLYAMTERPHTERILTGLLTLSQPYARINIDDRGGRDRADDEHAQMIGAIEAGDVARLEALIRAHLESARSEVMKVLAE